MSAPLPPGSDDALAPGSTFADHRVEAVIGSGGMGIVYRARNLMLDRQGALKVIAPDLSADEKFRERFKRESRLAASIEHPNVIPIHHAGEEGRRLYLAMRLVDGVDLRGLVEASGPLDPGRAARLIGGVAAGLDAAHARGLVHRDIKPANVLVEGDGADERVFLTDFGISRLASGGDSITSTGEFVGTVDYVAPEQIEGGTVDHRADVYSLACVLHYLLTGQPPFPRDTDLAKLFAHTNAPRPRPSAIVADLPPAVDEVVQRGMAKRPADRYGSAGELAEAAAAALGVAPPSRPLPRRPGTTATQRLRRLAPLRPSVLLGGLGLAVAGGIVAAVLATGGGGGGEGESAGEQPRGPQPRAVATIDVGDGPTGLTVGAINVWVASHDGEVVDAIDPATNRLARAPIPIPGKPTSVAVGFGSIWAVNGATNSLLRLDPAQSSRPITVPVGTSPSDVAVDERWVWVANEGADSISRIDPNTNQVDETVPVGDAPRSIATGEGAVWVTNIDGQSVSKVDPAQAKTVGTPISLGQRPNDIAVGEGSVWVIDNFNGTLSRIDPDSTKVVGDPIDVGSHPRGVKTGFGHVWVANGGDDTVVRVDPKRGDVVGSPTKVGKDPADIAVGKGAVWTANFDASTVTRIRP